MLFQRGALPRAFLIFTLLYSVFALKGCQQCSAQTAPHCSRSFAIIVDRFVKIARKTRTPKIIRELARRPEIRLECSTRDA
uniref:Secreted protein n=1 Tax=Rhipicephalus zambeziensis TaxID=60191 RepID=A0A224YHL4_9ACAR